MYIYIVYIVYSFSSATFPLKSIRFFIPHPPSKLQRSARPDRSPVEEGSKHPGFDVFFKKCFLMFFWCFFDVFPQCSMVCSAFLPAFSIIPLSFWNGPEEFCRPWSNRGAQHKLPCFCHDRNLIVKLAHQTHAHLAVATLGVPPAAPWQRCRPRHRVLFKELRIPAGNKLRCLSS